MHLSPAPHTVDRLSLCPPHWVPAVRDERFLLLSTDHELIHAGVNVLSAVREEYIACRWTEDFLLVSDKQT
jgi:hypothetical protein